MMTGRDCLIRAGLIAAALALAAAAGCERKQPRTGQDELERRQGTLLDAMDEYAQEEEEPAAAAEPAEAGPEPIPPPVEPTAEEPGGG